MKCWNCNSDNNPESARFCNQCGAELKPPRQEESIQSSLPDEPATPQTSPTTGATNGIQFATVAKAIGAIVVVAIVLVQAHIINNPFASTTDESNSDNAQITPAGSVTFCKKVDDNLNPIDPGDTFKRGEVYIRLESNVPFGVSNLLLYIYSMKGNGFSLLDNYNLQTDPQGNIFAVPYTFTEGGSYRIAFRKYMNENFAVGVVTIR
jgi:hypothetical protein